MNPVCNKAAREPVSYPGTAFRNRHRTTMASHRSANFPDIPYTDPNPLPSSVPHVDELGVSSAPLKSASFFIGEHCKDVNGKTSGGAEQRMCSMASA